MGPLLPSAFSEEGAELQVLRNSMTPPDCFPLRASSSCCSSSSSVVVVVVTVLECTVQTIKQRCIKVINYYYINGCAFFPLSLSLSLIFFLRASFKSIIGLLLDSDRRLKTRDQACIYFGWLNLFNVELSLKEEPAWTDFPGGEAERESIIPNATLSTRKTDIDESHFNTSLIMRGKITWRSVHKPQVLKRAESRREIEPRSFCLPS